VFSTAAWRSCTADDNVYGKGPTGVPYTIRTTLPVFWSANHSVDAANAALKKQVDEDTREFLDSVNESTPADQTGGAAFALREEPRINQLGRLAVVQMTGEEDVGGASGFSLDNWVNIDTDTWTTLTNKQILLPAARQPAGAARLATLIASSINRMGLSGQGCKTSAAAILSHGKTSYQQAMQFGLEGDEDHPDVEVDLRCPTAPGQGSVRILIREGLKPIA